MSLGEFLHDSGCNEWMFLFRGNVVLQGDLPKLKKIEVDAEGEKEGGQEEGGIHQYLSAKLLNSLAGGKSEHYGDVGI